MIVCSCTRISSDDIARAMSWMRAADPEVLITPGKVYRALGKAPDCGGCMKLFVAIMRNETTLGIPMELRNLRASTQGNETDEGRPQGHRVSQPGASQRAHRDQPVLAALPAAE